MLRVCPNRSLSAGKTSAPRPVELGCSGEATRGRWLWKTTTLASPRAQSLRHFHYEEGVRRRIGYPGRCATSDATHVDHLEVRDRSTTGSSPRRSRSVAAGNHPVSDQPCAPPDHATRHAE